jgi:hypothetical protein
MIMGILAALAGALIAVGLLWTGGLIDTWRLRSLGWFGVRTHARSMWVCALIRAGGMWFRFKLGVDVWMWRMGRKVWCTPAYQWLDQRSYDTGFTWWRQDAADMVRRLLATVGTAVLPAPAVTAPLIVNGTANYWRGPGSVGTSTVALDLV